jgi:hypothetical protein
MIGQSQIKCNSTQFSTQFRNAIEPPPALSLGNDVIERVTSFKLLGVWHQNNLKWTRHIEDITKKQVKGFIT